MSTQAHNTAITDLLPDTLIELYEISLNADGVRRFHPGKIVDKNILLTDDYGVQNEYISLPFEADGFEARSDGKLARPKLLIANPEGLISDIIKNRNDLVGNKIIRKRIFLKFIDKENFPENTNPFATSDPQARFDDDVYIINRKVTENKYFIEFELISPLEVENYILPSRTMIANYCPWTYRGVGCRYGKRANMEGPRVNNKNSHNYFVQQDADSLDANLGVPVTDENDKEFVSQHGYGLGEIRWAYDYDNTYTTVTTNGSAADGATSVTVDALSARIGKGRTIKFSDGSFLTLTTTADKSATSLLCTGGLRTPTAGGTLADDTSGTLGYVKGDFVRFRTPLVPDIAEGKGTTVKDPLSHPDSFFVCIQDHFAEQDPRYKTEYWVQDQCGKTLHSCGFRFGGYESLNGLPFGGYPSIEAFRYSG